MPDATTEHGEGVTQGIVNGPLELSNAALVNNSVQKKLLLAAQRTPRFLFRAFRSDSNKRCENTLSHVYPLALQNEAPLIMFDIPKRTLADHALHHLKNRPSPSIFSDWTHSLHCALEKAYELSRNSTQENCNTYLAVIDIKRLPSHIIALHSSAFKVIDKRIPKVPTTKHKFLIYGRIQGSAYKAVPFRRLLPNGFNWLAASMESALDPELEMRLAKDFGQLFGAYFKLPVTAMLLAGYRENGDVLKDPERMEFLVRALQNFDVPAEWATDATIMGKDAITARYKDVSRTICLLRALVVAQFGEQDPLPARAGTSNPGLLELLRGSGHGGQGQGDEDEDDFATSSETSSDQSDLSADEEVAGPALPPGVMDVETKRSIQEALKLPVTVALLTYFEFGKSPRDPGIVHDLPTIIEGFRGCKIPRRLCADASILTEIVYVKGYEKVERMIMVLRALIDHYHGRGARNRAPSPTRPQTYVRRSSLARTDGYQFKRGRSSIGSA
ncbi:hypothetical protein KC331_g4525 [Hortaea werneckii]|nr:hypothetical protein KC331_g4525 [Hortaea werneckii]KAI7716406.1 hypothetical protein KC353_g5407 [Hortaea werneckii]